MINQFKDEYRWLSNFEPCDVQFDGITYPSVEHAYQAAKTIDLAERELLLPLTAGQAKRYGRKITMRPDWDDIKVAVMKNLLQQKFAIKPYKDLLRATGAQEILEGNNWGDVFWGVNLQNNKGANQLGRLIMSIRDTMN